MARPSIIALLSEYEAANNTDADTPGVETCGRVGTFSWVTRCHNMFILSVSMLGYFIFTRIQRSLYMTDLCICLKHSLDNARSDVKSDCPWNNCPVPIIFWKVSQELMLFIVIHVSHQIRFPCENQISKHFTIIITIMFYHQSIGTLKVRKSATTWINCFKSWEHHPVDITFLDFVN